jgi:hypothetical protein
MLLGLVLETSGLAHVASDPMFVCEAAIAIEEV